MAFGELLLMTKRVSIFRSVLRDPIVKAVLWLIEQIDDQVSDTESTCAEIFRRLAEATELSTGPMVGTAWQNHLLEIMLSDDNVFARKAEISGMAEMGDSLLIQTRSDMDVLRMLYELDLRSLWHSFPPLDGLKPIGGGMDDPRLATKRALDAQRNWRECVPALAKFYAECGAGEFGRYRAFRWVDDSDGGRLLGVESPDPIQLSDLVEYEWQRDAVRRNTEKLLSGLITNNMLLYGDRGTGKSSTVKAMLNEFAGKKLRIVEVAKENLIDLPRILAILRKRPEKYILFLDDLSFEENETQYKALKAVLEGGLEARPSNVVLYATSNRRNLIRERFSDRQDDDEVHPGDTMQEKLSLSDRFGLKVPFLAPDQEEFLHMVTALAGRAGVELTDELRKQALAWQHARSGRSARQFVDYVIGELALDSAIH